MKLQARVLILHDNLAPQYIFPLDGKGMTHSTLPFDMLTLIFIP